MFRREIHGFYDNRRRFFWGDPLKSLVFISLCCLLTACASSHPAGHQDPRGVRNRIGTTNFSRTEVPQGVEKRLWTEYRAWEGTQHTMGGRGRAGVDCSAFVQSVYEKVFHIQLPRTTRDQVLTGTPVSRRELRPGDLVFFRPPTYPRHVGIYLNGDTFMHASKTKGVTVSKIDPHYWGRYYWTARRVLP
jgi:cell wall-associated NlpC family hydrolase